MKAAVFLVALLATLCVGSTSAQGVYAVSVRWVNEIDFLWVNIVLSQISDHGIITDLVTIDSNVWGEDVYYPSERTGAMSTDGTQYFYSIWNPSQGVSTLYTVNLQTNKVQYKVAIPFETSKSNGQPIRSMNYIAKNNLAVLYGNVLVFIDPSTGNVIKSAIIWDRNDGTNATKESVFDPSSGNYYIQARNYRDGGKPCEYTYIYNVAKGSLFKGPCLPASRGTSTLIYGLWPYPQNSSLLIACFSDFLGTSISLYNPVTGDFPNDFFPYNAFVGYKVQAMPDLNTFTYNPNTGQFFIKVIDSQEFTNMFTFGVPDGTFLTMGPITGITSEEWQPVLTGTSSKSIDQQ